MKGKMKWLIGIIIIAIIAVATVVIMNEMQFSYKIEEVKEDTSENNPKLNDNIEPME